MLWKKYSLINTEKLQTIAKFLIPTSQKELARFLGMAGYYKSFCLNFSEIGAPLTNLLSKKVKCVWQMIFNWRLTKLSYYSYNPLF